MIVPLSCVPYRQEILARFRDGGPRLREEAKAHLGDCPHCLAVMTEVLDQKVIEEQSTANGKLLPLPAEAQQALARGREVLRREFGIVFPPKETAGKGA